VILARKDAPAAYHLACVVDDAESGVTLVTRAADLRPSTPVERLLQMVLALPERAPSSGRALRRASPCQRDRARRSPRSGKPVDGRARRDCSMAAAAWFQLWTPGHDVRVILLVFCCCHGAWSMSRPGVCEARAKDVTGGNRKCGCGDASLSSRSIVVSSWSSRARRPTSAGIFQAQQIYRAGDGGTAGRGRQAGSPSRACA
jgi:hypothetical protein